jgi:DNA replication and repair protein RecF
MRILHLSLTNFRNFSRLELDLPPGIVVLQGDNAQGKTNLLEAIYYLSRVRSPRTSTDRELVNWLALEDDLPFARLVAKVLKGEALQGQQIELTLLQSNGKSVDEEPGALRKHIRVNGAAKRAVDAIGQLNAVLFLPEDIELVSGSPYGRRRYLDDTLCQIDPRYCRELQHYERVLTQRNYLLKSLRGRSNGSDELLFWDQRLVEHGTFIVVRRQQVIEELDHLVQRIHSQLTGDAEHLRLEYCASLTRDFASVQTDGHAGMPSQIALPLASSADMSATAAAPDLQAQLQVVAARFSDRLREVHIRELEQGVSVVGPHRDDLRFLVDGVDMNTYGSRGQQRTIALSVKLAEVELITREKRDKPVLLLDDVLSELDASRRGCLTQAIDQAQQVIITTNDLHNYDQAFLDRASLWQVQAGRLERITPASRTGTAQP